MSKILTLADLRKMAALHFLFLSSILPSAASAQSNNATAPTILRKRTSGIVSQKNGKAWAGVRVTLHSLVWPGIPQAGGDKVVVKTDARGRFRAMLLEGRQYDAWALAESLDGLHYRTTQVLPNVFAGMPLRLQEVAEKSIRVTVQLCGVAAWRDRLPFRLLVKSGNKQAVVLPVELDANEQAKLPALPGSRVYVTVFVSDGSRIGKFRVETVAKSRNDGYAEAKEALDEMARKTGKKPARLDSPDRQSLDLTAPPYVVIKLKHRQGGKPIAFSAIQDPVTFEQIAKTNERGLAAVPIAKLRLQKGLASYLFMTGGQSAEEIQQSGNAMMKGEPDRWGGKIGGRAILKLDASRDIGKALASGKADLEFTLKRAVSIKGRLLLDAVQGAANRPILHFAEVQDRGLQSHSKHTPLCTRIFYTDQDGRFEIPGRVQNLAYKLAVVLSPKQVAALNPSARFVALQPLAWFAIGKSTGSKESLDLGDVRLDQLETLDIAVTTPDGSPANRPSLLIDIGGGPVTGRHHFTYTANRRGRFRMLLAKDVELTIAAGLAGQVEQLHSKKREGVLRIELKALYLRGRVVNGQGQPLPKAHVILQPLSFGSNALLSNLLHTRCISDDKGRFRLAVQADTDYFLWCSLRQGNSVFSAHPLRVNFDRSTVSDYEIVIGNAPAPDKARDKDEKAKRK